ncbi:fibronectin type III-like domain-contianing protein [Heminiphilus faecis]|jgi:hypothetical protein|uniref:Fibronectin type III-like domain-contianing protein n=1 Tax=Heminiphilus faecis TaxID=2601703 RepID=A0ABV4CSC5_9BACT|nr:fibronectin type III-like domain-contianing protein [Heminiphilus faecis]RLT77664.1 hypothetical protein D7V95_01865 [bacterium J10(2018)]
MYNKVELNPLNTKSVKFEIIPNDLKFFYDKAHGWIDELREFKVYIGSSNTDMKSAVIRLQLYYKLIHTKGQRLD